MFLSSVQLTDRLRTVILILEKLVELASIVPFMLTATHWFFFVSARTFSLLKYLVIWNLNHFQSLHSDNSHWNQTNVIYGLSQLDRPLKVQKSHLAGGWNFNHVGDTPDLLHRRRERNQPSSTQQGSHVIHCQAMIKNKHLNANRLIYQLSKHLLKVADTIGRNQKPFRGYQCCAT